MVYLDSAATTEIHPDVLESMMPYLTIEYGNAGTTYGLGRRAFDAMENARSQVAQLIGCRDDQIIFTSGGSESNALAIRGVSYYLSSINKKRILVNPIEHKSVLNTVKNLCIKEQFCADFLRVDSSGIVDTDSLLTSINSKTGIVSVMHVNNELGSVNPIEYIGKICKDKGVLFHTDCVQSAGSCDINVNQIGCDFLSISSHKIHGAKGIGALYVKDRRIVSPLIPGGSNQEFGIRGGTANVAGIVGFGKACELISHNLKRDMARIFQLKQEFLDSLMHEAHKLGISPGTILINGSNDSNKIINLRFDGVDGQSLVLMLSTQNICISAGSACTSGEDKPSHVLTGIGLSDEEARESIRVSFSTLLSMDDIRLAARTIIKDVQVLLNMK